MISHTTKKMTHLLPGCFNNRFEGADDLVRDRVHEGGQYVVLFWCLILIRWVLKGLNQGVTKRCRLSQSTNSPLVYEPECGGRGGVAGSQPMSTAVHRSPNELWCSNFIINLWVKILKTYFVYMQVNGRTLLLIKSDKFWRIS